MPLHPEFSAFLELADVAICNGDRKLLHELTPQQARDEYDRASPALDLSSPKLARVENLTLPTRSGMSLSARLYSPQPASSEALQPVLLFFPGGGYVVGSIDSHDGLCRSLAQRTPCAVLSLQYRLAPEHKFPAPIDDALSAFQWLSENAVRLGFDVRRIAIGGDSAGATIAAALALMLRDHSKHQPVLQLLMYPATDPHQKSASHRRFAAGYLLESATIEWFFQQYQREAADREDWRFNLLAAPNVAGVAPAHIVLAEFDPLVDEGFAYAEKLSRAGVSVTVNCYDGMLHDFMRLGAIARDEVTRAHEDVAQTLAKVFAQVVAL